MNSHQKLGFWQKLVSITALLMLLLAIFPFMYNSINLMIFANQLNQIDKISSTLSPLGSAASVQNLSNSEGCTFIASRIFNRFGRIDESDRILLAIDAISFHPARGNSQRKVDKKIHVLPDTVVVVIEDGPYFSYWDPRCL